MECLEARDDRAAVGSYLQVSADLLMHDAADRETIVPFVLGCALGCAAMRGEVKRSIPIVDGD